MSIYSKETYIATDRDPIDYACYFKPRTTALWVKRKTPLRTKLTMDILEIPNGDLADSKIPERKNSQSYKEMRAKRKQMYNTHKEFNFDQMDLFDDNDNHIVSSYSKRFS